MKVTTKTAFLAAPVLLAYFALANISPSFAQNRAADRIQAGPFLAIDDEGEPIPTIEDDPRVAIDPAADYGIDINAIARLVNHACAYTGTGILVSPRIFITAGHCVRSNQLDVSDQESLESTRIYFGYHDGSAVLERSIKEIAIEDNWDIAIVILDRPVNVPANDILGTDAQIFDESEIVIEPILTPLDFFGGAVEETTEIDLSDVCYFGYAGDVTIGKRGEVLTTHQGAEVVVTVNNNHRTTCIAYKGASGGPLLVEATNEYTGETRLVLIGIASGTYTIDRDTNQLHCGSYDGIEDALLDLFIQEEEGTGPFED